MKKLYSIFAFTFLLNFLACLHWSFANENLPKDALPVSRPKPVLKLHSNLYHLKRSFQMLNYMNSTPKIMLLKRL